MAVRMANWVWVVTLAVPCVAGAKVPIFAAVPDSVARALSPNHSKAHAVVAGVSTSRVNVASVWLESNSNLELKPTPATDPYLSGGDVKWKFGPVLLGA